MDCNGRCAQDHTQLSRHSQVGWRCFVLAVPQSPPPPAQVTTNTKKKGKEQKISPQGEEIRTCRGLNKKINARQLHQKLLSEIITYIGQLNSLVTPQTLTSGAY